MCCAAGEWIDLQPVFSVFVEIGLRANVIVAEGCRSQVWNNIIFRSYAKFIGVSYIWFLLLIF